MDIIKKTVSVVLVLAAASFALMLSACGTGGSLNDRLNEEVDQLNEEIDKLNEEIAKMNEGKSALDSMLEDLETFDVDTLD